MPNRLAHEPSPYLRQHADNPVDWYPWGQEALAAARERDVPILLSVGYSACHWCHVMERESFDDPATAEVMNRLFVNIKVDREERPDVDGIYMGAVQALTGRGGWPLTAFLTPDGRPFYGGTYFPPEERTGMPAFTRVLAAVHGAWSDRRDEVERQAERLSRALAQGAGADPGAGPGVAGTSQGSPVEPLADRPDGEADGALRALGDAAFHQLAAAYDPVHGGFGGAPKFPQPVTLEFLLAWGHLSGEDRAVEMVLHTLRSMARGGIMDHLGKGFHRYSVDREWLVPHFEKMLYDNALLARVYLDGWRISGDNALAGVCRETLRYVLTDLRDASGAFHSARDADSEGDEGRFYVWTPDQIRRAAAAADVSQRSVDRFLEVFGVTEEGNFEGRNILHLPEELETVAERSGMDPAALDRELTAVATALRGVRETRVPPFRDEKVIVAWNGFAIRALAEAGAALPDPDLVRAAVGAGEDLFDSLVSREPDGRMSLCRIRAGGQARIPAYLEDWASLGNAALSLYEATLDPRWYRRALELLDGLLERFGDPDTGLLFDAPLEADGLLYRPRDLADSATPSGNSLAVELLLRMGTLAGRDGWLRAAREQLEREAAAVRRAPAAYGRRLAQVVRLLAPPVEIAMVAEVSAREGRDLLAAAHAAYHPARVIAGRGPDQAPPDGLALLEHRTPPEGRPTAWVCRHFTCQAPVHDGVALTTALAELD